MKKVLVTGSNGFIGKNLIEGLRRHEDVKVTTFDIEDDLASLAEALEDLDIVFHLAGVNRPEMDEEFEVGNADLTRAMVDMLEKMSRFIPIVFSSSIQATFDNPYGKSKKLAEDILIEYCRKNAVKVFIYRLPNVFGKWCRPNYNSVVATFCHHIAREQPITVSDSERELELIYVDDLVAEFIGLIEGKVPVREDSFCCANPTYRVTLGQMAEIIRSFRDSRQTLLVPDFSNRFIICLYATYLSYLPPDDFIYTLTKHSDQRGELAELLKSPHFGQIFVSRTRPGIVRGNHYHDTKVEKFAVLDGEAVIQFRQILGTEVIEYAVSGKDFKVVDIPPGYTHSIENVGQGDLIVLFWANQIFDAERPDTYFKKV